MSDSPEGEMDMPARIRHLRAILESINDQLQQHELRPEARAYLERTADACITAIRDLAGKMQSPRTREYFQATHRNFRSDRDGGTAVARSDGRWRGKWVGKK